MQRLVIALTSLLTLTAIAVVAGYLFIFGPGTDRAAGLVPSSSIAYVTAYLSPSTGQETGLADLLTRLPGFSDRANLGEKIDQVVQRSLSGTGLDYHEDVVPWIGDQVAVAVLPASSGAGSAGGSAGGSAVLLAQVRDETQVQPAIERVASRAKATISTQTYHDVEIRVLAGGPSTILSRMAVVSGMLVATADRATLEAVIDTAQGRSGSLADLDAFRTAMRTLPADRLGSIYLSVSGASSAAGGQLLDTGAYSSLALAVVASSDGLTLTGSAPFNAAAADSSTRSNIALGSEPSGLPEWMPAATQAELVFFGAKQAFDAISTRLGSLPGGADAVGALTQLRALAALGLGIDLDRDLLPLFDREAAVALQGLDGGTPRGQLLLRPSDPSAAATALERVTAALRSRGSEVTQQTVAGTTVTTVAVPQTGTLAYAVRDGVIIVALGSDDVSAALTAHASGETLGASAGYRAAFEVAGGRGGNELYVEGIHAADLLAGLLGQSIEALPADVRDILTHIGAVALAVPSEGDEIQIHATVTVH